MNLLIVESPRKARTLSKILGKSWKVEALGGPVLGIEGCHPKMYPEYKTLKTGKVKALAKVATRAHGVFIASDPSPEGDFFAQSVSRALAREDVPHSKMKRLRLHELTKTEVDRALHKPETIKAFTWHGASRSFQARAMLDLLMQQECENVLRSVMSHRTHVQIRRLPLVALSLLVKRERSIRAWVSQQQPASSLSSGTMTARKSWVVVAKLQNSLEAVSEALPSRGYAERYARWIQDGEFKLKIARNDEDISIPTPSACSGIDAIQELNSRCGLDAVSAASLLSSMYEDGMISFPESDETRLLDPDFLKFVWRHIKSRKGTPKDTGALGPRRSVLPLCVRPTLQFVDPVPTTHSKTAPIRALGALWDRTVRSQLPETYTEYKRISYVSKDTGRVLLRVHAVNNSELTPKLARSIASVEIREVYPQSPPRYTEGELLAELASLGFGFRSGLGGVMKFARDNHYFQVAHGKVIPSIRGEFLVSVFERNLPDVVDVRFQAKMEKALGEVDSGKRDPRQVLGSYYYNRLKPMAKKRSLKPKRIWSDLTCGRTKTPYHLVFPSHGSPHFFNPKTKIVMGIGFDDEGKVVVFNSQKMYGRCEACGGESLASAQSKSAPYIICTACGKEQSPTSTASA